MERERTVTVRVKKITRKRVFAEIVASKERDLGHSGLQWMCCGIAFDEPKDIHKHVSHKHHEEIEKRTKMALKNESSQCRQQFCDEFSDDDCVSRTFQLSNTNSHDGLSNSGSGDKVKSVTCLQGCKSRCRNGMPDTHPATRIGYDDTVVLPWLPSIPSAHCMDKQTADTRGEQVTGEVLLFYKYVDLSDPDDICRWQKELCRRLQLRGKVRVAREGLNGTVGGQRDATQLYISAVMVHPCFANMAPADFKTSKGGINSFPDGLLVCIHKEIVPMGIEPTKLSYKEAGSHLTPREFHEEIQNHKEAKEDGRQPETVFVDCRNFYESKIGQFEDALTPNIRKFSYWPEYVDKNEVVFANKRVLMYCTGGIRCERGSAYLKSKGICKEVLQLKGGIHRYLEQYPDGFFRGKLFVFDDRYSISTNQDIISGCFYCSNPWDQYQPCTSECCHQLVLSCPHCRDAGCTTCCVRCAELTSLRSKEGEEGKKRKEECSCTMNRQRIPMEGLTRSEDTVSDTK